MARIAEDIHQKGIGHSGLSRGEVHCHQRREGSRLMYNVWLVQGTPENETSYFISEDEIDKFIQYLVECKHEIVNHRKEVKKKGHKT